MSRYSTELRKRKYIKLYEFLSFAKDLSNKYGKKLFDTATKAELNPAKTTFIKVVNETAD